VGATANMHLVRSYAIYGAFGLVSGFLTPHLSDGLHAVVPDWTIIEVPLSLWLAGLAFALALAAACAYVLGFQPRQLLIIPYVLAGWFCAVQICLWLGADEPKSYVQPSTVAGDAVPCVPPNGVEPSQSAHAPDQECFEIEAASGDVQSLPWIRYWRSVGTYFVAGAIGAFITALGIPVATRRLLARSSYLAITLTGALVATAWFILAGAIATLQADANWYALFAPWQAAVALAIRRSLDGRITDASEHDLLRK
jgi:hypothetical protein